MRRGQVLFPNLSPYLSYLPIPTSSENNHEDDFSGSDNDFLGFYDE